MDEKSYADLVALAQFLPGPASSQVGIGIGVARAGVMGGIVSFIGFTFPSVVALILFAMLLAGSGAGDAGWLHGLKIVAVAVVAHAILGMARNLTPDVERKTIALFALIGTLLWQTALTQVGIILLAGIAGLLLFRSDETPDLAQSEFPVSRKAGAFCLALFAGLLAVLPVLREVTGSYWVAVFDSFYRAGALVFGGGHVVLPLLEQELVPSGWVGSEAFLAGYGAAQAVPGPLFTFASYLGAAMDGWQGGLFATFAIFLPAYLLIVGALPFLGHPAESPPDQRRGDGCECGGDRDSIGGTVPADLDKLGHGACRLCVCGAIIQHARFLEAAALGGGRCGCAGGNITGRVVEWHLAIL